MRFHHRAVFRLEQPFFVVTLQRIVVEPKNLPQWSEEARHRRYLATRTAVREFPFRPVNVFFTMPLLRVTVSERVAPSKDREVLVSE
jgi:hypothetical protein